MKRVKKTPYDYEIFSFRATKEQKKRLRASISEVVKLYNKRLTDEHYAIRKNDVIMEALEKGLSAMKRLKPR